MNTESKPDPQTVVDETRKFWHSVAQDTVKSSSATIDETARQIIGIVAILEGLYFHAITFSDLRAQQLNIWDILPYAGPLVFWVFSLISACLVFLPRIYKLNMASSEAAKEVHEDVIRRKHSFLLLSFIWLIIGSAILVIALGDYLMS